MGFLDSVKKVFGLGREELPYRKDWTVEEQEYPRPPPAAPPPPMQAAPRITSRRVIEAPVLGNGATEPESAGNGAVKIKAQPSRSGLECTFLVNRPIFAGHSWAFSGAEAASGWPLAEELFALGDEIVSLVFHDTTLTVKSRNKRPDDWLALARRVGDVIRRKIESGGPLVSERALAAMPSEEEIKKQIQEVIEKEINPGVASHEGRVTLLGVKGNTVSIHMGGGCQGCSSAAYTLKMGIEGSFRRAVPFLGLVLDETDHAAGVNPYFR
ncbi:MAG: NifU family protein [Bdellovibrionota bacterium]